MVGSIYLVSNEHLDDVLISGVGLQLVEPVLDLGEGIPTGDVIDDDHALASAVVARRQRPESLLSGCVPDGQLHLVKQIVIWLIRGVRQMNRR